MTTQADDARADRSSGGAMPACHLGRSPTPTRAPAVAAAVAIVVAVLVAVSPLAGLISGPVPGTARPAAAEPVAAGTPGVTRYFGRGAYEGIRAAVAATPRACDLSDDNLTALVMAPIFKEVSMAETPEAAPSPMTLSRWDEWSGVRSGADNLDANYGLYPFRDPATPYARAYWTPGIGIFQYDVAGVGAPFTAAELMDVGLVARDVAAGMADRYCAASGDDLARRAAAWEPWSGLAGVAKSEALFQEMVGLGQPAFSRIGLVEGIDGTGGMEVRTCLLGGTPVDCAFVDPGRAQGANWWATDDPAGGAPGSGMAPLTAPFYVVERDGKEERHWMAQDTGYPVHVQARRALGQNARPRDGQPGSGLEWFDTSGLCDPSRSDMDCQPAPGDDPSEPGATGAADRDSAGDDGDTGGDGGNGAEGAGGNGGNGEEGAGGDGGNGADGAGGDGDSAAGETGAGGTGPAASEPAIRLRDGLALIPAPAG